MHERWGLFLVAVVNVQAVGRTDRSVTIDVGFTHFEKVRAALVVAQSRAGAFGNRILKECRQSVHGKSSARVLVRILLNPSDEGREEEEEA